MGSRGVILANGITKGLGFYQKQYYRPNIHKVTTFCCSSSSLQPPNVPRLAQTARISLSPHQVDEFAPKISQVVDWFGQLQAVDLESIEPSIRADTDDDNLRDDVPQTFDNREAMIGGVPKYEEPYIRVPKVLNKE